MLTEEIAKGILHEVPSDMQTVLAADTQLLAKWNKLTPIQRNEWICWVTIVKKSETRVEHIQRMIEDIPEGKKKERDWFRRQLMKFEYIMIQKSVWVGPSPLPKDFLDYLKEIKIGNNFKTFKLAKPYNK